MAGRLNCTFTPQLTARVPGSAPIHRNWGPFNLRGGHWPIPGLPVLGVRLDSPLHPPRLSCMSIELLRKRLPADRASFIEPCLPSPADKPPSGSDWIHEIKHDGYRLMARRDPGGIRLITRRGNDWLSAFPWSYRP